MKNYHPQIMSVSDARELYSLLTMYNASGIMIELANLAQEMARHAKDPVTRDGWWENHQIIQEASEQVSDI